MFYIHSVYIYSNNLAELRSLAGAPLVTHAVIKQAVVDQPAGVIVQKTPKWAFRSYLKGMTGREVGSTQLYDFIISRPEVYGITPGLAWKLQSLATKWYYISSQSFIDHNHISDITMLSLVQPGIIRKTMSIVAK